ncbi:MAG TPA: hypothetical protein VF171_08495, partial [Trueperaceae bacterium]
MTRTLEGFIRAAQRTEDPYVMLPFEVPPGTHRIDVRARNDAGSILDFGLTDPRLEDFPSRQGFRGWSGSARDS